MSEPKQDFSAIADDFWLGSLAALESFRAELLNDRGHIENEIEPAFDVIVDLLGRTIKALRAGLEAS